MPVSILVLIGIPHLNRSPLHMRRLDVALHLPASEPGQDVYLCIRTLRRFEEIIRLFRPALGRRFLHTRDGKGLRRRRCFYGKHHILGNFCLVHAAGKCRFQALLSRTAQGDITHIHAAHINATDLRKIIARILPARVVRMDGSSAESGSADRRGE